MRFEFGDVVLVPFPFTSHAASKRRPAAIVSNAAYARARPDLVLMAITGQLRPRLDDHDLVLADWAAAGLVKPSAVKPVFATLEQTLVLREMGRLGEADAAALRRLIAGVIG